MRAASVVVNIGTLLIAIFASGFAVFVAVDKGIGGCVLVRAPVWYVCVRVWARARICMCLLLALFEQPVLASSLNFPIVFAAGAPVAVVDAMSSVKYLARQTGYHYSCPGHPNPVPLLKGVRRN